VKENLQMSDSRLRRTATGVAAVLGAGFAAYLGGSVIFAAGDNGTPHESTAVESGELIAPTSNDLLLPATSGREPVVFRGEVSLAGNGYTLSKGEASFVLRSGAGKGEVCVDVKIEDLVSTPCWTRDIILTGMAFAAYGNQDSGIRIVGVLPDDAGPVSIAGAKIEPQGNIWFYEAKPGDDLTFSVSYSDGAIASFLGNGA